MKVPRPILILVTLTVFLAGAWMLTTVRTLTPESQEAREAQADRFDLSGDEREAFMMENELVEESEALIGLSDYFYDRYLYPAYQFDNQWLIDAQQQAARAPEALPAGRVPTGQGGGLSQLTHLGPNPLDGIGGGEPVQGRLNTVAIDPVSPTVAYFGSDGGGVFKTTNCCSADTSWFPVTDEDHLQGIAIGDIHIDPTDHNIVYAGTGDLRYGSFSFGSSGLLKSTDQGETWQLLGQDVFGPFYSDPGTYPQYNAIGKVRVNPNNNDQVAVGTKKGVHFSYDGGMTWTEACVVNPTNNQRQDVTGLETRDDGATTRLVVAIGTRGTETTVQQDLNQNGANGIYLADWPTEGCPDAFALVSRPDNGWPLGTGSGINNEQAGGNILGRLDMAVTPADPDVIYVEAQAIITNQHEMLGIWKTTDLGVSWNQVADNDDVRNCVGNPVSHVQNWYDQGMAVDPNDPDRAWFLTLHIHRTTDGGATWENTFCAGDFVHVDQHSMAYVPGSSSEMLFTNDGGIYYSDNVNAPTKEEVSFTSLGDNFSTSAMEFYGGDITMDFATDDNPGVVGGMQDNGSAVYQWALSGTQVITPAMWVERRGGDGMRSVLEPTSGGGRLYMQSQNGVVARYDGFTDTSGFNANGGWNSLGDRVSFVMPLEINRWGDCTDTDGDGYGCEKLLAGSHRIWETIVGAAAPAPTPIASTWYPNSPDLTKNTLGDRSFVNQMSYAFEDDTIAIAGTNDGNVQIGFGMGQGITDTATWVDLTAGNAVLPNRPILDVITGMVEDGQPLKGYAAIGGFSQNTPGQPGHVYEVTCNADCSTFTWANKSGNLPNVPVDSIMINPNLPEQVFAGTDWGLYFTNDVNSSSPYWYRLPDLPHVMIWDLTVDRGYTTLAIFTRSRGVYALPLPLEELPVEYRLYLPLIQTAGD